MSLYSMETAFFESPFWTAVRKIERKLLLIVSLCILWMCFRAYYFELMLNFFGPPWERKIPSLLDRLELDCEGISEGENRTVEFYKQWIYDANYVEQQIISSEDRCSALHSRFEFRQHALSIEEADFPLAYGLVVYKNIIQVLFMLSSFYNPQNVYCIAVDDGAPPRFHILMRELERCLPNVHVIDAGPVGWGSFEVISAVHKCLDYTTSLDHPWKYYQYLAGVDVPLKTNLEMVRILKALNETINFEVANFANGRLNGKNRTDSPLPLYKSSISALIPRVAANFIVNSREVGLLLSFLKGTKVPDESFWGTVGGNRDEFPVPGALNANEILELRNGSFETDNDTLAEIVKQERISHLDRPSSIDTPARYYISRYQIWANKKCGGKTSAGSCIFGVADVETLLNRPELVAHKLYIDYQPAAFFCVLKEISRRTRTPQPFSAHFYSQLPQVELKKGMKYEELTRLDWIL